MQGHFEIGAYHTPQLTEDMLQAELGPKAHRAPGDVLNFLAQFEKRQEAKGKNLMMHHVAICAFDALFNGAAGVNPYARDPVGTTLGVIALTSHDAAPGYQDVHSEIFGSPDEMENNVGAGSGKRFYEDEVEPYLISEGVGTKESLTYRGRWLWLPAEAVNNDIRSISVSMRETNTAGDTNSGIVARIRLKDSGGSPIIVNKTAAITLYVEYKVTVVSV